eukprot:m.43428 g.43428  ORF g.43428 m.43428 type:complete len:187 (+) comp12924_c0_seq3:202-762(+)
MQFASFLVLGLALVHSTFAETCASAGISSESGCESACSSASGYSWSESTFNGDSCSCLFPDSDVCSGQSVDTSNFDGVWTRQATTCTGSECDDICSSEYRIRSTGTNTYSITSTQGGKSGCTCDSGSGTGANADVGGTDATLSLSSNVLSVDLGVCAGSYRRSSAANFGASTLFLALAAWVATQVC